MSKKSLRFTLKALQSAGYVEYEPDHFKHKDSIPEDIQLKKAKRKPKGKRTGWTDDCRNNRNTIDPFIRLVQEDLKLEVWAEFHFAIDRKWRFDYCIPSHKIAIEVEGGVFTNGRHTRGVGFLNDMEKYNTATTLGWRLIRTTPSELSSLVTLEQIKLFL